MSYLLPEKEPPKPKRKSNPTIVRESSDMSPTLTIAALFAYKYARTKNRWFSGRKGWNESKDEYGLTLDPSVTSEADFIQFRKLVMKLKQHYHYDLLK